MKKLFSLICLLSMMIVMAQKQFIRDFRSTYTKTTEETSFIDLKLPSRIIMNYGDDFYVKVVYSDNSFVFKMTDNVKIGRSQTLGEYQYVPLVDSKYNKFMLCVFSDRSYGVLLFDNEINVWFK